MGALPLTNGMGGAHWPMTKAMKLKHSAPLFSLAIAMLLGPGVSPSLAAGSAKRAASLA